MLIKGVILVLWVRGVTPQEAVMGHTPGHMIVLDVKDDEVFSWLVEC